VKRRRDRILFLIAALFSIAMHVAALYLVFNLPIGSANSVLFADIPLRDIELTPIDRSPDDLIVTPGSEPVDLGAAPGPGTSGAAASAGGFDPASVGKLSGKMLGSTPAPANLKAPGFNAPAVAEGAPIDPTVIHAAPKAAAPTAAPSRVIDATPRLLAGASPKVALPEFVGETDRVVAETPITDRRNAAARIDVAQLKKLDDVLSPAGAATGIGSGVPALGLDPGNIRIGLPGIPGVPGGMGPGGGSSPPPIAAITPKVELPKLPPRLPEPPPSVTKPAVNDKPVIHLDEDFDYQLRVLPELPADPGFFGLGSNRHDNEPGWYEVRISPRRSLRRLRPLHKDVIYVLDTSESVPPAWIEEIKAGVVDALDSLNDGDRFNLVLFKDNVSVMSPTGLLAASPANKAAAPRFLKSAESSGWTDLNKALGQLIVRHTDPDRVYQIVLLSDGIPTRGEIDAREIINLITRENDLVASIFAVAVGDRTNNTLLEFLTYRNKGFVVYPKGSGQCGSFIRDLAARLRYPVVKDATFTAVGVDSSSIYPRIPRDMYQGEPVLLYGRYTPGVADRLSMRLGGVSGADVLDLTFTLDFRKAQRAENALATEWAFWKLHHLYSEIIRQGETPALKKQIEELKDKYKLKTTY
jgi:uncharacterized protein YegL